MKPQSPLAAALVSLLLGTTALVGGANPSGPPGPDIDHFRLVKATIEVIDANLVGTPTPRTASRARVAALMLAESAQQHLAGPDAADRGTLRDAALQVASLIADKKFDDARKLAAQLPRLPANPKARLEKVRLLGKYLDIEELMSQFRSVKLGGLGIEARIDQLAAGAGAVPEKELTDELRLMAYRTWLAAGLARDHVPENGKVKEWQNWVEVMNQAAKDLGRQVGSRDGKSALAAVNRLNTACNKCHLEFR
jgi:cytochrome c556